jgi:hypothetical protein
MSAIRCRRSGSQRDGFGDDVLVALEEAASGDDVDAGAEEGSEVVDEVDLVEEGPAGFELDEEIDIAVGGGFASSDRTEDPNLLDATSVGEFEDLGAAFPERVEGHRHDSSITRSPVSGEQ